MDHRWSKRSEISLDVIVHCRNGMVVSGKILDISHEGMFIDLNQHILPTNTPVEIEILAFYEVLLEHEYLHGWVIHSGDEGSGVMFRALGVKEKRILNHLLADACP